MYRSVEEEEEEKKNKRKKGEMCEAKEWQCEEGKGRPTRDQQGQGREGTRKRN